MARLVSYKAKDENRYSTFGNEVSCNSNENLTEPKRFKLMPKKKQRRPPTISELANANGNRAHAHCPVAATVATVAVAMNDRTRNRNTSSRLALCPKLCCQQRKSYPNLGKCWWYLCCWGCCNLCKRASYSCDDDDDDIDAKFEQYKYEMRMKESGQAVAVAGNAADGGKVGDRQRNSFGKNGRKYWNWNWNDSLRSNSDKFLETLEHDLDGGDNRGFRRSGGYCNPVMRITKGHIYIYNACHSIFIMFSNMRILMNERRGSRARRAGKMCWRCERSKGKPQNQ